MDSGCDLGDCSPDLDCDGLGLAGGDSCGNGNCDISSYSFDGGDVDVTAHEVMGESAGDMSSADYSVTDCEDGNPIFRRHSVANFEPKSLAAHVTGHRKTNLRDRLDEIAGNVDLVRIPWIRVGSREANEEHAKLLPLSTWSSQVKDGEMSAGWYHGATGTTTVWRKFYCVGKRVNPWNPFSEVSYDRHAKTFVEVTGITWRYNEAGDSETRVLVRVTTLLQYDKGANCYFALKHPLAQHNERAVRLKASIFRVLKRAAPTKQMIQNRKLARLGLSANVEGGAGEDEKVVSNKRQYGVGSVLIPA